MEYITTITTSDVKTKCRFDFADAHLRIRLSKSGFMWKYQCAEDAETYGF
jgi:hypothetical protein